MIASTRVQRRYDHRLRELVRSTGDIQYALQRGVPRSTARGWLHASDVEIVTFDVAEYDVLRLQQEVLALRRRAIRLIALLRLLFALLRATGFTLTGTRIPDDAGKQSIIRAVERSRAVLPLRITLNVLRLSATRYHAWKREQHCGHDHGPTCPRTLPHQLTPTEINTIKRLVTSDQYRHVPTGTLAILAQRLGKVFASPSTWYRLIRKYKWRRPRQRVHPAKPKLGIRASRANEIWHVDTTLIRLIDGSRAYLHAVIDNFSRRILAWRVSATFNASVTAELLLGAAKQLSAGKPTVLVDGGVENFNGHVDELINSGVLKRLLTRTEITFSNSLIESWWRVLKHQWLYLNTLDKISTLEKLVAFYVGEHNSRLPHSAFRGQTPDEMYFGTGNAVPQQLEEAKLAARLSRMDFNRQIKCQACELPDAQIG